MKFPKITRGAGYAALFAASLACAQPTTGAADRDDGPVIENIQPGTPKPPPEDKRVLGVLPNYRTTESSIPFQPLTAGQKLHIAMKDSFDWPSYITAAGMAGLSQLENTNPSFGQGIVGYSKRYAGGVADQIIGNMMTEGFFPAMLHEDPRYFRMSEGTKSQRLWYAMSRIFVTKTDSGAARFNFSEIGGNAVATAIGSAYYRDQREVGASLNKFVTQVSTDMISNVLKEFWPDIKRLHRNRE